MVDLIVITPSRGRPHQLGEMVAALQATTAGSWRVWVGFDNDDETDYLAAGALHQTTAELEHMVGHRGPRRSLSGWTNHLAQIALDSAEPPRYLASLGDDHRPRTPGWDRILIDAIEALPGGGFGIAYGNDLLQGERLPTAWVMSADIVRALGWMMLPTAEHMYVDAAILALGRALDRIVYRPDVVIEHLHPLAGKAGWDASYRASNSDRRYAADRAAFETWEIDGLAADAKRVVAEVSARRR